METHRKGPGERRIQILDAARTCFVREGFHAASMARLASLAGISVGHVYRYFPNKEAIVAAIAEEDLREAAANIAELDGPEAIAAKMMDNMEKWLDGDKRAMMFEVLAEASRNPKVAQSMRDMDFQIRAHLRQVFERGRSASWTPAERETRANMVCLFFDGLAVRTAKTDPADLPAVTRCAAQMLARLLECEDRQGASSESQ